MNLEPLIPYATAGLDALWDYIAEHVLTCLVPAFLLAGAMVSFINREVVLRHLGGRANLFKTFALAAGASFLVAACSCTVIPVAAGLYFAGAGIGAVFIVLWVAPAANVLALVYTGNILGAQMVSARVAGALLMAMAVGLVMTAVFHREERRRLAETEAGRPEAMDDQGPAEPIVDRRGVGLFALLLLTLLMPNYLVTEGPYWQKVAVWAGFTALLIGYAAAAIDRASIGYWLRETWWFVRTIFPLLLVGVFIVGVVVQLIPDWWIERWLGGEGLLAALLATLIGAVSYFATMTEAPFVAELMGAGMGKGPALALLLAGPGVSLPNWLVIARLFGWRKALVYAPTIMVLAALVGWAFGNLVF